MLNINSTPTLHVDFLHPFSTQELHGIFIIIVKTNYFLMQKCFISKCLKSLTLLASFTQMQNVCREYGMNFEDLLVKKKYKIPKEIQRISYFFSKIPLKNEFVYTLKMDMSPYEYATFMTSTINYNRLSLKNSMNLTASPF